MNGPRQTLLAIGGAVMLVVGVGALCALAYILIARVVEKTDREVLESKLGEYAAIYESGGFRALELAVQREDQSGQQKSLFVRLANARNDASAMPATGCRAAVRNPTAMATASSSSSSNGGMALPATSRYPPSTPIDASTGYPRSRSRSMSRRTVRDVTPNRSASSLPGHSRGVCSSDSRRNNRAASLMPANLCQN